MKKIIKLKTNDEVPEGAVFLSSKSEIFTRKVSLGGHRGGISQIIHTFHYFIVETKQENENNT